VDGQVRGGGRTRRRQLLEDQGSIEAGQAEAAMLGCGIEAAEALRARLGDRLPGKDRLGIPARRMRALSWKARWSSDSSKSIVGTSRGAGLVSAG
jgi:hypothetical protein